MRDFDDDHDWYEDASCPYCGRHEDCEHDGYEGDDDDFDDGDDLATLGLRANYRTQIVAERALVRCGMIPGSDAWLDAFAALVSRLAEQEDDPLAQRRPGWTVALPF